VALQNGDEFDDPNSYQSQALARTEEQEGIEMMTEAKIIQFYALYTIYTATNGVSNIITETEGLVNIPNWIVVAGWESNNVDPCSGQWFGISCVNDQVTNIDLFSNLLTGNFPPEVTLLAADGPRSTGAGAIRRIDLFDNMLLSNNGDNSWWQFLGSNFGTLFSKAMVIPYRFVSCRIAHPHPPCFIPCDPQLFFSSRTQRFQARLDDFRTIFRSLIAPSPSLVVALLQETSKGSIAWFLQISMAMPTTPRFHKSFLTCRV
jgi:hypothetical protein